MVHSAKIGPKVQKNRRKRNKIRCNSLDARVKNFETSTFLLLGWFDKLCHASKFNFRSYFDPSKGLPSNMLKLRQIWKELFFIVQKLSWKKVNFPLDHWPYKSQAFLLYIFVFFAWQHWNSRSLFIHLPQDQLGVDS